MLKYDNKEVVNMDTFDFLLIFVPTLFISILILIVLAMLIPTYSTSTFSLNTDSGVLTINATFFGATPGSPVYSHYIINNATEELPNGTIIRPAKSYVEVAIAAACTTANYELHVGNGNYYTC